jgi:hypothetical protein
MPLCYCLSCGVQTPDETDLHTVSGGISVINQQTLSQLQDIANNPSPLDFGREILYQSAAHGMIAITKNGNKLW